MKKTHRKTAATALTTRPLVACVLAALATTLNGGISASAQTLRTGSIKPNSTLAVTSCADDGSAGTLRSVVATAVSGDTVDLSHLDCSTITLENGEIEVSVDALTLAGPGRDLLTIDGHDASRILWFSGQDTLTVTGLTLTRGRADSTIPSNPPTYEMVGGCVPSTVRHWAGITMTDAAVTHCTAIDQSGSPYAATGGGIYAQGPINLTRVIVSNNTASDETSSLQSVAAGGGLMAKVGSITLTDSIVQGNAALTAASATGGGVFGWLSDVTLTNSVVDGNFAGCDTSRISCTQAQGGGISTESSKLYTSLSTISNNTVSASGKATGGGGMLYGPLHRFADTQISGNQAISTSGQAAGGGAYATGTINVRGSTISGNSADEGIGGGLFIYYGNANLSNSTISGNSAGNAGAIYNAHVIGYYASNLPPFVHNSTITANTATASSAPYGVTGGILDTQTYGHFDHIFEGNS